MKRIHIAMAVFACALFGGNAVINKIGLTDIPPLSLALLRFSFSLFFLPFFKRPNVPLHKLAMVSICSGLQWLFLNLALHLGCGASLTALITQAEAGLSFLFSYFFFGTKPKREQYAGLFVSSLGILILSFDAAGSTTTLTAVLCSLMTAVFFGLVAVLTKWAQSEGQSSPVAFSAWTGSLTCLFLLPFVVGFEGQAALASVAHISLKGALCVSYSGLIACFLGTVIFAELIRKNSAPEVTQFTVTVPLFALAGSALFLHESITPTIAVASVLIIGGLFIGKRKGRTVMTARPNQP